MTTTQTELIYTVSHLNSEVRDLLENNFIFVWVEGEISNFAVPHSGHWYFSLKDSGAQVRCAMFKGNRQKIIFTPKNGMHVLIKARVSLYENRGEYQLIVENIEEQGEGKLRLAFEALKKKLTEKGWFDQSIKKKLPLFPKQIGIITSQTGAALRDILHVLERRFPCASVILYPTLVQGEKAAEMIAKAIQLANEHQACDILILARGGGSLEDLWPFNEEIVAAAIFNSLLPIISGVGHETDFTIADFVSDLRAPTPSAAAELATPDKKELMISLLQQEKQIIKKLKHFLTLLKQKLFWSKKHLSLKDPKKLLQEKMQRLDVYESSLIKQIQSITTAHLQELTGLQNRLHSLSPAHHILLLKQKLQQISIHLDHHSKYLLDKKKQCLLRLSQQLHALSPLATLDRGYSIVLNEANQAISNVNQIKKKDIINIKMKKALLVCQVKDIK